VPELHERPAVEGERDKFILFLLKSDHCQFIFCLLSPDRHEEKRTYSVATMMGAQVHPESEPFLLSPMTPIDISPESHPEKVQWQRHHQCGTRYQHNHRKWWFSIAAVCGLITLIFLNVAFYLVFLPTTDRLCAQRLSTYCKSSLSFYKPQLPLVNSWNIRLIFF
jgi:hypothetical protein